MFQVRGWVNLFVVLPLVVVASPSSGPSRGPASKGLLLVANKGEHTLGIVDPEAGRQLATVPESGITGHEVAASPDGRTAWVPIYGNSGGGSPGTDGKTLDVIDIPSRKRLPTMDLGRPARPPCALAGP